MRRVLCPSMLPLVRSAGRPQNRQLSNARLIRRTCRSGFSLAIDLQERPHIVIAGTFPQRMIRDPRVTLQGGP